MYSVIGFKRPTSLFPMKLFSDWQSLLSFAVTLVTAALTVYLIYLTRNFIKNLLEDKIFDQSNTRLANQAWKVFLALTFLSILTATGNLLQPPFSGCQHERHSPARRPYHLDFDENPGKRHGNRPRE